MGSLSPYTNRRGSIDDPHKYRSITLLNYIGTLCTASINTRLATCLDEASIIGEEQAGFREGYSTLDHIFVLHSLVELSWSRRKRLYCAFIDYKKTFDLVDRSSVWSKLISCGINGSVLKVIYNMYENGKYYVKQGQALSDLFSCNVGVRLGENCLLCYLLFNLNDSRSYKGLDTLAGDIHNNLSDNDVEFSSECIFYSMLVILLLWQKNLKIYSLP